MSKDWFRCLQPGGVWLVTVAPPTAIGRKRKHAATSNHAQQVSGSAYTIDTVNIDSSLWCTYRTYWRMLSITA
jgi:hypothetical protein